MIDLHNHILAGIDDGPVALEQSLAMLDQAIKQGITVVAATPHLSPSYQASKSEILRAFEQLQQVVESEQMPIELVLGQEVRVYGDIAEDFAQGKLLSLVGHNRHILIELPSSSVPRFTEQVFYQLYQQGLTPVIAHPERNRAIQENPDLLYDLVEKGALAQLTASSLTGSFGKKVEKLCHQLIDANLIHLIASDAHGVKSRKFRLKEAYQVLEKKYGWTLVEELKDNAQMILDNKPVRTWEPQRVKRKKLLGIF